jgi:hypothetical protein
MRTLKYIAFSLFVVAAANSLFAPARAQTASVADIKATAEAIQTLQDQQKTLADNQTKIDTALASIAENVRVARIYAARAK